MSEKLLVEYGDDSVRVTINRPEKRNCLDNETLTEWLAALKRIDEREDVKSLSVHGAGEHFSAGADLSMFLNAIESDDRGPIDRFIRLIHEVTGELEALDIPTVAAVDGYALAGGLEVLLACDLRVATESATIGDQHANYGLVAGGGGTQRLIRQIDVCKANELMYTGRRLTGAEAAEWGLVNRAVPEPEFHDVVDQLVTELGSKSRGAAALTKRLMRRGKQVDKETALELERQSVVDHYFSKDAVEGFTAFAEDRQPEF